MLDEEWIKTLEDGRRVKFTNQELPDQVAFITAQIGGNKVVYSGIEPHAIEQGPDRGFGGCPRVPPLLLSASANSGIVHKTSSRNALSLREREGWRSGGKCASLMPLQFSPLLQT
jgi:hypothetical protein